MKHPRQDVKRPRFLKELYYNYSMEEESENVTVTFEISHLMWDHFCTLINKFNKECNDNATPYDVLRAVVTDDQYVEDHFNY